MNESTISNRWGVAAPYRYFHKPSVTERMNKLITGLLNIKLPVLFSLTLLTLFYLPQTTIQHI